MKKIVYPWHQVAEDLARKHQFDGCRKVRLSQDICKALSQSEIAQRYESGLPRSREQLLCLPYVGSRCPYVSEQDVNRWLKEYAPFVWAPHSAEPNKMEIQEKLILDELCARALNPLRLQTAVPGKAGVKKKVKDSLSGEALLQGKTVFNKAWERLLSNGEIAYLTVPQKKLKG
jgi:hypothetical protein